MMHELPEEAYHILAELFQLRILNGHVADAAGTFEDYQISLIEKALNPSTMRQWRPIAVISVLAKVFSSAIAAVVKFEAIELHEHQFAFRPGYQAAENQGHKVDEMRNRTIS